VLDPGIGFGKTPDHNIAVLRALDRIVALGFPTLLATSRKSTIGRLTGRDAHERTYGTAATVALGIAAGVDIVRVHDVAQMRDVVSVSDAIERGWRPAEWIG
jgi:dihydropteroate synthase